MTTKKMNKKGQAGLNIFAGVIVSLFMIGLIVAVFVVSTDKLLNTSGLDATATASQTNLNLTTDNTTILTDCSTAIGRNGLSIGSIVNATGSGATLSTANYTVIPPCNLTANSKGFGNYSVNVSYSYDYRSTAQTSINETGQAIGSSSDWFSTFIILAALVVLILMIVLIVTSIRGTGYIGGGNMGIGKDSA